MIVYKVTSPSNKVYIGITSKNLKFRKQKHYIECKNNNTNYKLHNALRKYGENLIWEELDFAISWEELCLLEYYYIQKFDSYNNGYNMTLGGDGGLGYKHTEESKKKMRKPRSTTIKMRKPKNHGAAVSVARLKSQKVKELHSNEQYRNKMAMAMGGRKFKVFRLDTNELIGEWTNQSQCERDLNIDGSVISKCLKYPNKCKSHKGYTFKYVEEVCHFKV